MAASLILVSIAYTMSYKSLPFENGDRFVVASFSDPNAVVDFESVIGFDPFRFQYFKDNASSYSTLGAMRSVRGVNISDGETPEVFIASDIESSLLNVTGIQPLLGRSLQISDDQVNGNSVVVISHALWQSYYSGRYELYYLVR
jgi:hypothetical protein